MRRDQFDPLVILQRREGEFLDLLGDVPVLALHHRRAPRCVGELARLLRQNDVRIVYTATTATNIYGAIAAWLAGCRSVISEHTPLSGNLAESKWKTLRLLALRRSYPLADLAVAPLPPIGDELRDLLGNRCPPFLCLPNPVVDRISPPRDVPDQATRLVSVGRLAEVKRFDLMIAAFALLRQQIPAATLEIIGEGPDRARLQGLVDAHALTDAVSLSGFASDVAQRLRDAHLFLCTSRREGFGNAIAEAMAAAVPVISVDCPVGPRVLLRDGKAGRLVHSHTAADFGSALIDVAADAALRRSYVAAGREVAGDFTVPAAVAAHEAAFRAVLERSS
nr:glycosyltransferase [Paracoccus jeotgali]